MKMNPYDFVRVDWNHPPERHAPILHNRFDGLSGRIEGTITAETPLFVKKGNTSTFFEVGGNKAIPGSALKGMFRSVVETVGQGCFWFCADSDHLQANFRPCSRPDGLCPACRLFGLIKGSTLRLGNVSFTDAVCPSSVPHDAIYTAILSSPKPRHTAFYRDGNDVAGRKFYFHHRADNLLTARGWLPPNAPPDRRQNQHIQPVGAGSVFIFAADFSNVAHDDFPALLYALRLEPEMRHKIGYAKPCGLGSIRVELMKLVLWEDPIARYRQGAGERVLEGADLTAELNTRVARFVKTIPANTLADLRRIWAWPPATGITYAYPTQGQFAAHPNDAISTTDTW